jgi:hypothetical protein
MTRDEPTRSVQGTDQQPIDACVANGRRATNESPDQRAFTSESPNIRCAGINKARISLVLPSALLLGLATSLCSCAKLDLNQEFSLLASNQEPQVPDRMVCVWTDALLQRPPKAPLRGFGGRIMFYAEGKDEPVKVNGQLTAYAFGDEAADPSKVAPEKKFIFPPRNLPLHYSSSKLGHSYSFWLPWDDAGGLQRRISLICRFDDVTGKGLMSEVTRVTLPGTVAPPEETASVHEGSQTVRQVSYDSPPDERQETPGRKPTLQTTTIDVTPGFAAKLLQARRAQMNSDVCEESENRRAYAPQSARGSRIGSRPEISEPSRATREPVTPNSIAEGASEPVGSQAQLERASPQAPSAHSGLEPPPVQNGQSARPFFERVPREHLPARAPSRLPPTPRSNWTRPRTTSTPTAEAAQNLPPYAGGAGN